MEQHRRRTLELAQLEMLCAIRDYLNKTYLRPTLEDSELESLGILRWTNLDVDNESPCDFEPRFFSPCYDVTSDDLEEEGNRVRHLWGETKDRGKATDSDNVYKVVEHEDDGLPLPHCYNYNDLMYLMGSACVPALVDKPHMAITMFDVTVPPEDKMLHSELDAAVTCLRAQVGSGLFTDHHTKPVLVCTLQWETHARITQVHLDAKLNKLVVRQSRLLDLRGKEPTPDAWILLRWLVNTPVGTTRYEGVEDKEVPNGNEKLAAEQPVLVELESR